MVKKSLKNIDMFLQNDMYKFNQFTSECWDFVEILFKHLWETPLLVNFYVNGCMFVVDGADFTELGYKQFMGEIFGDNILFTDGE